MRFSRAVLASVLAVVSLLGASTPQLAEGASLDSAEQDLVARINAFRAARSLPTLAVSDTLTAAAKWMSVDMGARNYFAHTSYDGRSPTQRMADAGYPAFGTWTGEDLAAGYTTTAEVLNGWINSPAHYAVLVNPKYHAIGVGRGYASSSTYGWYWTADFGGVIDGARAAPVARAATQTTQAAVAPRAAQPAQVAPPPDSGYHARWSAQSADPTLAPGDVATLVVALENTGSRGWFKDVASPHVNLGTNDPLDAEHPELAAGWLSANRLTSTTTGYVGPGEVGWFEFTLRAPAVAGDYRLSVQGVVEGVRWFEDDGIFFTIHVLRPVSSRFGLSFCWW
ncbi:MAG: CAP domain-containing protein [Chloroflexota bacterium]|nr:CAP domain-containing protein [Chloroflexota bacterium]